MQADAALVLFPKFTTLVSDGSNVQTYTSAPLDVAAFGSAQFQVWRGDMVGDGTHGPTFKAFIEESTDGEKWVMPSGGSAGVDPGKETARMLSYAFRLRFFRLRIDFKGRFASCWAEGLLR